MSSVVDKDLGFFDLMKLFQDGGDVLVGIREEDGSKHTVYKKPKKRAGKVSTATIAEYATYNEFGMGVDERSFLRSTLDENREKYIERIGKNIGRAIDNGDTEVSHVLDDVGERAARDVQKKIRDLREPENAESTIERKGSSNPLIDTGTMRNAISYEVRKKK